MPRIIASIILTLSGIILFSKMPDVLVSNLNFFQKLGILWSALILLAVGVSLPKPVIAHALKIRRIKRRGTRVDANIISADDVIICSYTDRSLGEQYEFTSKPIKGKVRATTVPVYMYGYDYYVDVKEVL